MSLTEKQMERLAVIRAAIEEIANRPDLRPAARERGVRALKKAEARLLREISTEDTRFQGDA